jgi:hypothetical protein
VPEFSSNFEPDREQPFFLVRRAGRVAAANAKSALARGSGSAGARVAVLAGGAGGQSGSVLMRSAARQLGTGATCNVQYWARAGRGSGITAQLVRVPASGSGFPADEVFKMEAGSLDGLRQQQQSDVVVASQRLALKAGHYCLHVFGPIQIREAGQHVLQFDFSEAAAGSVYDIDDVEVYCSGV